MNTEKKTFSGIQKFGQIWSFNPTRDCGSVIDNENFRYYFNKINVIAGKPEICVGDPVKFFTNPERPVPDGRLPVAYAIEILTIQAGIDGLASPSQNGADQEIK